PGVHASSVPTARGPSVQVRWVTRWVSRAHRPAAIDAGRRRSPRLNPCRDTHWHIPPRRVHMAFTRAQATALLNKSEMTLFDDSRANALRDLDRAALAGRVERTRAARDRARDLLKRQRL